MVCLIGGYRAECSYRGVRNRVLEKEPVMAEQTFKILFSERALDAMDPILQDLRAGKDEGDGYLQEFLTKLPNKRQAMKRANGYHTWELELTLEGLRHFGEEMAYRWHEAAEAVSEGDTDRVNERNACRRALLAINEIMVANDQPSCRF